jgi:ABC-2 type transport system ATP-binding protein
VGIIHLRDLLTQLRDQGCAIIVSSHRLGELEKLTSDYVYLQHGRIVTLGETAAPDAGTRLHIALESGGGHIAESLLSEYQVLAVAETGLDLAVQATREIPDIVNLLSRGGARITGVWLQKQDVEGAFLRLYQEIQGKS